MGEISFRSAGISTREIDLSAPTVSGPTGIPAGIIGTSQEGPAFVPLTFASYSDFRIAFGVSDGKMHGPIAVNEWLRSAGACTYLRVLGIGNGKKRDSSTGNVAKAGFVAGSEQIKPDGTVGANPYAVEGGPAGRTHFLGVFMKEETGSTIFQDAGIVDAIKSEPTPILRGVLLAPSGVMITLARGGEAIVDGGPLDAAPSSTAIANVTGNPFVANTGAQTGSVHTAGGGQEFTLLLNGHKNTDSFPNVVTASFDVTSPSYIRNILNSDPLKMEEAGHLLYASYDVYPTLAAVTSSDIGAYKTQATVTRNTENIAFILTSSVARIGSETAAGSSTVPVYESFEDRFTTAKTPFVISQAYGSVPYSLFRVHALSAGAVASGKFKISIENIVKSTEDANKFGTFDLLVRKFEDTDEERGVIESFRGLSLDPGSSRYIARAIGDQNVFFNFDNDAESQKLVIDGTHPVRSRYIRVEMSDAMKKKEVPDESLPLGFRGPSHLVTSGTILSKAIASSSADDGVIFTQALFNDRLRRVVVPPLPYRQTVKQGTGNTATTDAALYWGLQSNRRESITLPNKTTPFDESLYSYVKHFPDHRTDTINFAVGNNHGTADVNGSVLDADKFQNNKFTLENIKVRTGSNQKADPGYWVSASYVRNGSIVADESAKTRQLNMDDFDIVANRKYLKFTLPLQGGFDGSNIFNRATLNLTNNAVKREIDDETSQGGTSGPTVSAYRKAVDIMADTSGVDIKLLSIPGIRHSSVTDYAIRGMENRFDALYIMDIEERDQFNTVITSSVSGPHVANTVTAFKNRGLDSSFAAAYFPDVTVTDPDTGGLVSVPPSVVVLGAYSLNDKIGHPWFAPAGFTRGALNTVEMSNVNLNRENLDDLYDADINPLASYPGRGLSVWGQKTLLAGASALDRVNVRRLLIDVRRKVRGIANTLLFEPNRSETLLKFNALVNPILQNIQDLQGLDRFKVIIDTTTTTQADIENNTLRGKIFLQPTRTVEFVALDFVVTNAGSEI